MKTTILLLRSTLLGLALGAACALPALAADNAAPKPDAEKILREASSQLAAARQFTFKAHREIDAALLTGRSEAENADIEVSVLRPDKIMATSKTSRGERTVYADGKSFTIHDVTMNLYSTVPMHESLDDLVEQTDAKYGFTPPLAEFALSDPYKEFHRQARTVTYLGESSLGGGFLGLGAEDCYMLQLSGHTVDTELWIGVKDHLIKKLVATFNGDPAKPQIKIEFSEWNLAAKISAGEFTFVPPKGAGKIPMETTAEVAAPAKTKPEKN